MSEWQRDLAREATIPAVADVSVAHSGATGIAFLPGDATPKGGRAELARKFGAIRIASESRYGRRALK
jgi:hypothetical protein